MSLELKRADALEVVHSEGTSRPSAIDVLAARSLRFATVVQAGSPRRDVQDVRAKILLALLRLRCPANRAPAMPWYVPGAVVRFGVAGLLRAWAGLFGEAPPSERRLIAHIGALENDAALVRAPGEWIPRRKGLHPHRWPDTFHVLEDERDARWWADEGMAVLEREPEARRNLSLWRRLFRSWKLRARDPQAKLPFPVDNAAPAAEYSTPAQTEAEAAERLRSPAPDANPIQLLIACREAGAAIEGRIQYHVARWPLRLRAAMFDLARVLSRGTRVRNRAGYLVWAFRARAGPT